MNSYYVVMLSPAKKNSQIHLQKKPERQWHISRCFIVEDEILEVFRYSVALECSEWIQKRVYSICCSSTFWAYPKKWSFQQTKRVIHICNGFILQYITSFVRSWALLNTKRLKELIELPSQSPRAMFVAFVWLVSLWPIFTILHTVFFFICLTLIDCNEFYAVVFLAVKWLKNLNQSSIA